MCSARRFLTHKVPVCLPCELGGFRDAKPQRGQATACTPRGRPAVRMASQQAAQQAARNSRWGEGSMWLLMKGSHQGLTGEPLARSTIRTALDPSSRPTLKKSKSSSSAVASGEDVFSRLYSHATKHGPARSMTDLRCMLGHKDPFQIPEDELASTVKATRWRRPSSAPAPPPGRA